MIAGIVAIVAVAWAVTSLATGTGSGGLTSGTIRPLMPGRLHAAAPTAAELEAAFAAEGLSPAPAGSELGAARFAPLRRHIVAAFTLPGRAAMLVVLFDRPEPRAPMKLVVEDMPRRRDNGEAAGRVYVEYRLGGLDDATAAAVRRALHRLLP